MSYLGFNRYKEASVLPVVSSWSYGLLSIENNELQQMQAQPGMF
jgi:hypothetical protein